MENEVVIHLRQDGSVYTEITENGLVTCKYIHADDLMEVLWKGITPKSFQTGLLPSNMIALSVCPNGSIWYAVDCGAEAADITYRTTTYPRFPLPRLVFAFKVQREIVTATRVCVPEPGKLTEDTPLYQYPFSNVNGFSMCTGNNPFPVVRSAGDAEQLPAFVLGLPDNDDLYTSDNTRLGLAHEDLMEHLKDKTQAYYYSHVLKPMNATLKNFLGGLR